MYQGGRPVQCGDMLAELLDPVFHWLGGEPCCRVYGKARRERDWRVIAVYATRRRDDDSRWPLLRSTFPSTAGNGIMIKGYDPVITGGKCITTFMAVEPVWARYLYEVSRS